MNSQLHFLINADELARATASAWLDEIESANRAGKSHSVALSGGRITQKFFTSTVEQAASRKISFARIHFFWADERCVPPTDSESNFAMANEILFRPLQISPEKIHRLRGEIEPQAAVAEAIHEICELAPRNKSGQPILDLIFLGMGEDGHVASLFPNATDEIINCSLPYLSIDNSPKPPPQRISLSYAAIAAAKEVWVLVSGEGKEKAFQESVSPNGQTPLACMLQSRLQTRIFSALKS